MCFLLVLLNFKNIKGNEIQTFMSIRWIQKNMKKFEQNRIIRPRVMPWIFKNQEFSCYGRSELAMLPEIVM